MINEEALEAALLAKMVSSKLTEIDSLATERSNVPAARINMNEFLGDIRSPRNSPPSQQAAQSNQVQHSIAPPPQAVNSKVNLSDELKEDIKSIRCNMEKINNNLTKISGMFGKVFHNMSKNHND
jgi:hypothetical protein